ncbi:hypothetical protein HanIR_Chr14g0706091 [Helianthus annuus]|nr:hypothetical protein HanIR_Chr14g0706091 [Helianthus annuus]
MAPVTMTSRYLVLGQIRVIIPSQFPSQHWPVTNRARAGSGFNIFDMQARISWSVIFGFKYPVSISLASCCQFSVRNLMARTRPEAKTAPQRRTCLW